MLFLELITHVGHLMKVCHHHTNKVCPFLYGHYISIKSSPKCNDPYVLTCERSESETSVLQTIKNNIISRRVLEL